MATTKKKSRRTGVSDATIERRVNRGARLLDQKVKNWHKRIDIDRLHMDMIFNCILGQLFVGYGQGLHVLDIAPYKDSNYGFDINYTSNEEYRYARLRNAWIRAINRRIAKNKSRRRRSK